jgi:hypothetical protein
MVELEYTNQANNAVPDGGTTAAMVGTALMGLAALQRKLRRA